MSALRALMERNCFAPALCPYTDVEWPDPVRAPAGWDVKRAMPADWQRERDGITDLWWEGPYGTPGVGVYNWRAWLWVPEGFGLESDLFGRLWTSSSTGDYSLLDAIRRGIAGARELEQERDRLLTEFALDPMRLFEART